METMTSENQSDSLDRLYSLAREALEALKNGDMSRSIKLLDDAAYAAEQSGEENEAKILKEQSELLAEDKDVKENREAVRKLLDLIFYL
jgi:DNA polymerase III delta prime subunit